MKPRRWFRFSLKTLFLMVTLIGFLPVLAELIWSPFLGSNCGGNSAALSVCHSYATSILMWTEDHPNQTLNLDDVDLKMRQELTDLLDTSWIHGRFLTLKKVRINRAGPRKILVVCDRAYNNVPQRAFVKAPMTHAVGYSTGKAGLISPAEFAKLDLSDFVDLRTGNAP